MSATCQVCTGRATLALCPVCQRELRENLEGLAIGHPLGNGHRSTPWLDALADAATGHAKMGDGQPRARDEHAGVSFNSRASRLLDEIDGRLTTWVRHICESRAIPVRNVRAYPPSFVGPLPFGALRCDVTRQANLAALWLAQAVNSIACDEAAGELFDDVRTAIERIERVINRPVPPRFCGPCPSLITDHRNCQGCTQRDHVCNTRLMAKREAIEVRCPTCRATHTIDAIINRLLANVEHWRFTRDELIGERNGDWTGIMGLLEEPVSKSTFHRWVKDNALRQSGFRRLDGGLGLTRRSPDDLPVYRLSRVRDLRRQMSAKQVAAMRWKTDETPLPAGS